MKRLRAVTLALALVTIATADVGSPNVIFDGNAGPYPVRVIVRPPSVVPGLADVIVRVDAPDASRVVLRPVYSRVGVTGAPQGDEAPRTRGRPNVYTGQLWLMVRGAYSVYVTVSGTRGEGTAIVPVNSFATGRLGLSRGLGALLAILGTLLLAGLVTIIRAASGESLLAPGEPLDARTRRRANVVAGVATPILGLLVLGGAKWWSSVDAEYQRFMYRPPAVDAVVSTGGAEGPGGVRRTLTLSLRDTASYRALLSAVIPDHGKMMHLFLVQDPDLAAFAHLHPVQTDSLSFTTEVPGIPAGRYRLFGDLALENGTTLTVTTTVDVPPLPTSPVAPSDKDDAWSVAPGVAQLWPGASVPIENGNLVVSWAGTASPFRAGQPTDLRFVVRTRDGAPAMLEPYLGMSAHAVVMHHDGSVFVHLHPMGTVSSAAQGVFVARDRGDTTTSGRPRIDSAATTMTMPAASEFSLPYEFPKSGRYRLWVQVKANGVPWTAVFDVDVAP
jgi:hypothetical protein